MAQKINRAFYISLTNNQKLNKEVSPSRIVEKLLNEFYDKKAIRMEISKEDLLAYAKEWLSLQIKSENEGLDKDELDRITDVKKVLDSKMLDTDEKIREFIGVSYGN